MTAHRETVRDYARTGMKLKSCEIVCLGVLTIVAEATEGLRKLACRAQQMFPPKEPV